MSDPKVILTPDEAKNLLPDGDTVHTFVSTPIALIGADWSRKDVLREIDLNICELAGEQARAVKHGFAIHTDHGPVFVATDMDRLLELEDKKKASAQ